MKAVVLYEAGSPEHLCLEEREMPSPEENQVLIKVKAFGLNRSEIMTRKGLSPDVHFPRVLGIECVGEIIEDPSGEFKKGQKVAAFMGGMGRDFDGSYAEYAVLPKSIISTFESNLPWEILGALPEMFQTVFGSLHLALKIKKEETLLIRGGTSSIGLLAAQLAKSEGVKVVSTTRNINKKELLLENGVDLVVIDDGNISQQIEDQQIKIDKVLELVGNFYIEGLFGNNLS
ncbi:NADPH:quinone reductase-like Zn-dependent oxidoreductase [Chryseobacterium ginsenosidimutans]|uniref:alcohol dehydrogenase catalytic domain-containing protein n=1 Tax=Chryseobacterium ginsenosidimutans TaxID=687846 RepID=UPI00216A7F53|nr:alcohol dehydrogenase catalytic domain-containing protein [Chryseobacterium ginsenosidimutans]MCS3869221.1 NADPH:quinone reductase-like Zn-dependent oxidoreductase [Chryseobacterium ginsenosidimutans]